jgi:hypothetical protein
LEVMKGRKESQWPTQTPACNPIVFTLLFDVS